MWINYGLMLPFSCMLTLVSITSLSLTSPLLDDTVEVFASQFFSKKLTMHSIQRGMKPKIVFSRTIDSRCGASFSSILANLDTTSTIATRRVVDR